MLWQSFIHFKVLVQPNFIIFQCIQTYKPGILALHCQEVGGKNYEASMQHVNQFVKWVEPCLPIGLDLLCIFFWVLIVLGPYKRLWKED